ncbi:MAG TPA: MFS transporter [Terriglobia bacterium]|nr:MFS transporter [Terriglobia bacterium]
MKRIGPSRVRWLLVGWIALTGAVSYLDRVNISIAGHTISEQFHLSNPELGLVFSAFTIGYGAFQLVGGWAADRFGPRRVLTFGAVWWAVFTVLTTSVPASVFGALLLFLLIRFMLGAGESVMYPSSNRWLADWIPKAERGLANGIIFAGVGAGAAVTPPIIAVIMMHYGWREAFWFCGLLGLLIGLGWYLLARDRPEEHPRVNPQELKLIREGTLNEEASVQRRAPWGAILKSKDVWGITISYFCYGYVAYIFLTWFFIYLTTVRGFTLKKGSLYTMLPLAAMSVCSAVGGLISDAVSKKWGRRVGRCGIAVLGLGLAAILLALGALSSSATTGALIMAAGAGSLYLSQSSYWAVSADLGGPSAGTVSGFMNMWAQAGSAITAVVTPIIAIHFSWMASFMVTAGFCVVGSVVWLFVNPDRPLATEKHGDGTGAPA